MSLQMRLIAAYLKLVRPGDGHNRVPQEAPRPPDPLLRRYQVVGCRTTDSSAIPSCRATAPPRCSSSTCTAALTSATCPEALAADLTDRGRRNPGRGAASWSRPKIRLQGRLSIRHGCLPRPPQDPGVPSGLGKSTEQRARTRCGAPRPLPTSVSRPSVLDVASGCGHGRQPGGGVGIGTGSLAVDDLERLPHRGCHPSAVAADEHPRPGRQQFPHLVALPRDAILYEPDPVLGACVNAGRRTPAPAASAFFNSSCTRPSAKPPPSAPGPRSR